MWCYKEFKKGPNLSEEFGVFKINILQQMPITFKYIYKSIYINYKLYNILYACAYVYTISSVSSDYISMDSVKCRLKIFRKKCEVVADVYY